MAKKTKHFIALGDMKAVVLECKHCGSNMSYSFASQTTQLRQVCSNCGGDWDLSMSAAGFNRVIEQYISWQRRLKIALDGQDADALGYTMSIEIDLGGPEVPVNAISSPG
jgi:hypothetical protein